MKNFTSLPSACLVALFSIGIGLLFTGSKPVTAQPLPVTELNVIGGLSSRLNYLDVEKPFWTHTLSERSNAAVTAQIKGFDEVGLKGQELLRLMSQGVIEFGVIPLSYYAPLTPILESIDIAGLATDSTLARNTVHTFSAVMGQYFEQTSQVKLLGTAPYGAQLFFCRTPVRHLADLQGLTIRTITRTQADLVDALGAKSVNLPFSEVFQALERQSIHCAIAGSTAGFNAKWFEVSTHLYALPVGWNHEVHAVNLKVWKALPEPIQAFVDLNLKDLINHLWVFSEKLTQRGIECNTGSKQCISATKGSMTLVTPTQADLALVHKIAAQKVLAKWAERCTSTCVADFNQSIGKLLKVQAKNSLK